MAKRNKTIAIDVDWSGLPNIIPIIFPLVKNSLFALGRQRNFEILCKRYGLDGNNAYTLQEIGSFLGITRERVRQLEENAEEVIRNILRGQQSIINVPASLINEVSDLSSELLAMGPLFTEEELIKTLNSRYQYKSLKSEFSSIRLLLSILGFELLPDNPPRLNTVIQPAWITDSKFDRQLFFEARRKVDDALNETIAPIGFFDLVVKVNKGKKKPIPQSIVRLGIKTMAYVDLVGEDSYQVSFASLKSLADKAFRILYEQNKPLKLRELHREINHRLVLNKSGTTVPMRSISQQLINDSRFKPVGKGGWILATWENFTTSTTVDIIREYFYQKKAEANLHEIFNYVVTKRPEIKIQSVGAYLAQKDKFIKVSEDSYVPVDWKRKAYVSTRSSRKPKDATLRTTIQSAVQEYFGFHGNEWSKLSDLKAYVLKKCGCKGQTFYHYLSEMPNIVKEQRSNSAYCRMLTTPSNGGNALTVEEEWAKIISAGETRAIEFKRAAKWNDHEMKPDGSMVQQIVVEVAGFMNSDITGKIFIGIDDKTNSVLGIEEDIRVADKGKPNRDGYTLFLSNTISSVLGNDLGSCFEIQFHTIQEKTVCCIIVQPAPRIVYYEGHLYLRGNSQTNRLNAAEAVEYVERRKKTLGV